MYQPILLIFLGLQSVIFAGWAVLSLAILIGLLKRAVPRGETSSADDVLSSGIESYLRDPLTRFRRRLWLGLTVALVICGAVTVAILKAL